MKKMIFLVIMIRIFIMKIIKSFINRNQSNILNKEISYRINITNKLAIKVY